MSEDLSNPNLEVLAAERDRALKESCRADASHSVLYERRARIDTEIWRLQHEDAHVNAERIRGLEVERDEHATDAQLAASKAQSEHAFRILWYLEHKA